MTVANEGEMPWEQFAGRSKIERILISDEAARNRRLLDDEERRCDGWFDRDRELVDDVPPLYQVEWPS